MAIMIRLTKRQREIYKWIKDYKKSLGYSPTYREIGEHFNFNIKAAYDFVMALEKKGHVKTSRLIARSIVIVEKQKK